MPMPMTPQQQQTQPLTNTIAHHHHPPPPRRRRLMFRSAVIGPQQQQQPAFELQQPDIKCGLSLHTKNQFHNNNAAALLEVPVYDTTLKQKQQQAFFSSKTAAATSTTATSDSTYSSFVGGGCGWKSPRLTRLSMFHPLEQCHMTFPKHVLLSHMLPTLMDVFQKTSLLVTNFTDSPISVSCESMERVSFQVSLWQSRHQSDIVILEIQKVSGDAMDFQAYAQQILATARAVVVATAATTAGTTTITAAFEQRQQLPVTLQQQHQQQPCAPFVSQETEMDAEEDPVVGWNVPAVVAADRIWNGDGGGDNASGGSSFNQEQVTTEALEILHSILFSGRYDACRLGLESACCMTDPSKTGWSTACLVAQALLAPANDMQKQISTRILQWTLQSGVGGGDEAHHAETTTNWQVQELSYLALQALAQALQVAAEAQKKTIVSTFLDTTCGGQDLDLVAFLLNKVRTVQQSPHTAYFAIRALTALCQAIPQVSQRIAHQDVEYAQQVGVATHAALATVSGRLLVTLLQAC